MKRSMILLIASLAAMLAFVAVPASAVTRTTQSISLVGQVWQADSCVTEPILITSGTFEISNVFSDPAGTFTDFLQFAYRNVVGVGTVTGTKYQIQGIENSILTSSTATIVSAGKIVGPGPDNNLQGISVAHVAGTGAGFVVGFDRQEITCR
jgi:hypothetical protein